MPDIVIRCPTFGWDVPTGLSTETVVFESLDGLAIPLRCSACLKTHWWRKQDAWVDKASRKHGASDA